MHSSLWLLAILVGSISSVDPRVVGTQYYDTLHNNLNEDSLTIDAEINQYSTGPWITPLAFQ